MLCKHHKYHQNVTTFQLDGRCQFMQQKQNGGVKVAVPLIENMYVRLG